MTSSLYLQTYTLTAKSIFHEKILQSVWNNCGNNIWRLAWAYDTIIDFYDLFPEETSASSAGNTKPFPQHVIEDSFNATGGNWWDDYGWAGVASLRAAQRPELFPNIWPDYLKMAINCWCYMYGPGWRADGGPNAQQFVVPYQDLPGWSEVIANHGGDIGAPNVWDKASQEYFPSGETKAVSKNDVQPRFTPGGIWNSPLSDDEQNSCGPYPRTDQDFKGNLCGIQNTVTNALFTVFSLRLYLASQDPQFKSYFTDKNVNTEIIFLAWNNQMTWFYSWFFEAGTPDQAILYDLGQDRALIRERVSSFHNGSTDAGFDKSLAWTGDQGLMLGALREAAAYLQSPIHIVTDIAQVKQVAAIYESILKGVRAVCYGPENDPNINDPLGTFLHSWVVVTMDGDALNPQLNVSFPEGDDADYRTGFGVFYRYLLQAYQADPDLATDYVAQVQAAADAICQENFPEQDQSSTNKSDGLMIHPGDWDYSSCGPMTAWINRLALLCMAIRVLQKGAGLEI